MCGWKNVTMAGRVLIHPIKTQPQPKGGRAGKNLELDSKRVLSMMKLACRMQHEKVVREQLEELRKSERLNVLVKINDHRRTSALPAHMPMWRPMN